MILDCPQCSARFLVADALIPPQGRRVRCGTCAHEWHVEGPVAAHDLPEEETDFALEAVPIEEAPAEVAPLPAGSNVPALWAKKIPVRPFMIAAPALAALWLILGFFAYYPNWLNRGGFSGIYHTFGVASTEGLAFADVKMTRETEEGKTRFIFSGNVVNHADVVRKLPLVHVALKDKAGHAVWGRDYPVNIELKAGEVYPFRIVNVETSFGDSVATIILDLGHSLQLMMRG